MHFRESTDFIKEALNEGGVVLVHCFAGVSRSASIVIAYLMRFGGMSFGSAIQLVRNKRPWISPNHGFMNQLRRYDNYLAAQRKKSN